MMLDPPLAVVDGFSFLCGKMLCYVSAISYSCYIVNTNMHLHLSQLPRYRKIVLLNKTTVTCILIAAKHSNRAYTQHPRLCCESLI